MIYCIDCGKQLKTRNKNTKRCIDCYLSYSKIEDKFCIDCNKSINKYGCSKRCYTCNNIYQWKIGKRRKPIRSFSNILTKDFLKQKYIQERLSAKQIANILSFPRHRIYRYLKYYNIKRRTNSESHLGQGFSEDRKKRYKEMFSGKGNPNYRNGLGNKPYSMDFSDTLKYNIRKRDNYICQCCGLKEKNHIRGTKQVNLIVHHIDYNKDNCKEDNLITLCNKCNIKANGNKELDRDYWYAFYRYIMKNKSKEKK